MSGNTYLASGVHLDEMEGFKERVKAFSAMTHGPEVIDSSGGFAGLFRLSGFQDPVLVASADGVGTSSRLLPCSGISSPWARTLCPSTSMTFSPRALSPSSSSTTFLSAISMNSAWKPSCAVLYGGAGSRMRLDRRGRPPRCPASTPAVTSTSLIRRRSRRKPVLLRPDSISEGDCIWGSLPVESTPTDFLWCAGSSTSTTIRPRCSMKFPACRGSSARNSSSVTVATTPCWPPSSPCSRDWPTSPAAGSGKGAFHPAGQLGCGIQPRFMDRPAHLYGHPGPGPGSDSEMFRVFNMGLGMVAVCDQETAPPFWTWSRTPRSSVP